MRYVGKNVVGIKFSIYGFYIIWILEPHEFIT